MTQIKVTQSDKTAIAATYLDHMGSDLKTVNSARVSFGKESEWFDQYEYECSLEDPVGYKGFTPSLKERDTKLINYLAKHKHLSPFGHSFASFHVQAPIFVARQLVKHKFLRWSEISRRYVDDEPKFYTPDVWRGRSEDKKQGSDSSVSINTTYYDRHDGSNSWDDDAVSIALEAYTEMLKLGVAPEQARMVLPQSTMTEWHWSGSLDAFAAMCKLRCASDTQYESQLVANQISKELGTLFPVSWAALMENG